LRHDSGTIVFDGRGLDGLPTPPAGTEISRVDIIVRIHSDGG
jgi:hypothetical protein